MNAKIMKGLVESGLSSVSGALGDVIRRRMITPYSQERTCGGNSLETVWIIAEIPEENICLGFLASGYESTTLKWGLLFLDKLEMGDSGAWYPELSDLVHDCGYFGDVG